MPRATRASTAAAATSAELPPAPVILRAEDAEWWDAARAYDFLRGAASATESARKCRHAAKALFDCAKAHEPRAIGPLPALLVAGRDDETVWQQLELRIWRWMKLSSGRLRWAAPGGRRQLRLNRLLAPRPPLPTRRFCRPWKWNASRRWR